jgi:hypothetical protein
MNLLRKALLPFLLFSASLLMAQEKPLQQSEYGWFLSPHGTIKILVIYAEVVYDVDPSLDPQPEGALHWPKGRLPNWADEMFDPQPLPVPIAQVTKYYHDISLGQYTVLGDYVDHLVQVKESEYPNLKNAHGINAHAIKELNKLPELRTKHGLDINDMDLWKRGGRPGMPKEPGPDDPHSYDHIMLILRNSALTHGQGSVDAGSSGPLHGYPSDTQSRFGAMYGMPFEILKHEFNHLLLGGNNFHSGGGNGAQFQKYFINLQGGWSMMGAGGSSLLTCTGWDRRQLDWKPEGAPFDINARDQNGSIVNGDLDPIAGDTGVFVLRDFVTSGDVLRVKLPFIPEDRFQQWIWIENHLGSARNGSYTDRFHWEGNGPCVDPVEPGLFMVLQIDREERVGKNIFGGYSDYLRAIPATGMWDLSLRGDTIFNACPFGGTSLPYRVDNGYENPLSGFHELELPIYDRNGDGKIHAAEHWVPGWRIRNGKKEAEVTFFGRPEHAFRMNGNRRLGMDSDPSSANMMNMMTAGNKEIYGQKPPNVRTVYLNGISIELLEMDAAGSATIRVRNDDVMIRNDVRWCADTIALPPLRGEEGRSMIVEKKVRMLLDRSLSPTRITSPDTVGGRIWFSAPTVFQVWPEAKIKMEERSRLELRNGSQFHLMKGSELDLGKKVRFKAGRDSMIVIHEGAIITGDDRSLRKLERRGRVQRVAQ